MADENVYSVTLRVVTGYITQMDKDLRTIRVRASDDVVVFEGKYPVSGCDYLSRSFRYGTEVALVLHNDVIVAAGETMAQALLAAGGK